MNESFLRALAAFLVDRARAWRRDSGAIAAVEFAFIAPCLVMMMSLVVFAGEGFEVQRKVTMTLRTLTDLVTQQCDIGPGAYSYGSPCPSNTYTYSQITGAAALVMTPYSATPLDFSIAEIQTNNSSSGTGVLVWCESSVAGNTGCPGGATKGSSAPFPATLSSSNYVIYGQVAYVYNPLGIWFLSAAVTFTDNVYMLPRLTPPAPPLPSMTPYPNVQCTGC